jgi:hypothetical protein
MGNNPMFFTWIISHGTSDQQKVYVKVSVHVEEDKHYLGMVISDFCGGLIKRETDKDIT